ncbi:MAG TPA: VWA domain-containing protein [Thermoanaerobaculia bacterium]|nr:VWA domain-containing protein [Thermoanaerobaculia bacterium]
MIKLALLAAVFLTAQTPVPDAPPPAAAPPAAVPVEIYVQALDSKGESPRTPLQPGDFTVLEDSQPRPVVSVTPLPQPWRIVIYVDRVLTGSRTLRAAAGSLAERASELAALGTVELVVAEPQPRVVLAPTQSVRAIDEALSKLWLSNEGRDDVRVLRQRFREEKGIEGVEPQDRIAEAVEAETRIVRRQQDALAEWLVAQKGGGPRALFLVTDGFDADPAKFYRKEAAAPEPPSSEGTLEKVALETSRTAAALGWTAFPLPVGDASLPDLRRVQRRSTPQVPIGGSIKLGGKKVEQAPPLPSFLAPNEPLTWLAEATGGELVLQSQSVGTVLSHLRSRFAIRYEAAREMDGRPHAVELRTSRPDVILRARRWDVEGIPEAVAAARARRLLEGEEDGAGIEISARVQPDEGGQKGTLDLRVETPDVQGPLRLTLAGPAGTPWHHLLTAQDAAGTEPGVYRVPVPLEAEADTVAVTLAPLSGGPWGGLVVPLSEAPAEDALSVSRPALRIVPPPGNELAGKTRLKLNGGGEGVARVEVRAGERVAGTCPQLPCEVEVDLGRRARPQILQAVAYDAAGKEVARDSLRVNDPEGAFLIRIVEPATKKGIGPVDVEADVRAPAGRKVERVEFFWNDELAGTSYTPPYRQRVMVPRDRAVGYLRVAARLEDGSTAEDAMALNASELGDRIDVRLVELAVVVTDENGKPVPNLPKEAFRVRQDGDPQEISTFENAGELPLTVALAIDTSASMFIKLTDVRKAVASLLDTGLTNRDRAMLIDFDTTPRLIRPVTRDLGSVTASLGTLTPDGGTALWEAVSYSLGQLRGISGRKALVVYSDGINEEGRLSFGDALRSARDTGIPIYLIVANPRAERGEDGGFLSEPSSVKFKKLAEAGGGQVYFIKPEQDLTGVYAQILSELRSQYTLAFYPKDTAPPASWSKIEVEVVGKKGLTARTVSGLPGR